MNSKSFLFLALTVLAGNLAVHAQSTAFTYQGRLDSSGSPSTGSYDLRVFVFDAAGGGFLRGFLTNSAVVVSNGLFTTTLDFGFGVFNGGPRWLEIGVRSNGTATAFNTLAPRQAVLPAPYAFWSANASQAVTLTGTVPASGLNGLYLNPVNFSNPGNSFIGGFAGDGTGLNNVNALQLGGRSAAQFWQTGGNAGANPTNGSFLGTTDNQPVEIRSNNRRALRLEPTADSANVIGGNASNVVSAGVVGAVIAGGGASGGNHNRVEADHAAVLGGFGNVAAGAQSVIGGGRGNIAGGTRAVVGGGLFNQALGFASVIAGGNANAATNNWSTIGGGADNLASGYASVIPGGINNTASANFTAAMGYRAKANHNGAFVWADPQEADFASTATNQFNIRAAGGARFETGGAGLTVDGRSALLASAFGEPLVFSVNGTPALRLEPTTGTPNVIGGYEGNSVATGVFGATVFGGGDFGIRQYPNQATTNFATVPGGLGNTASGFASTAMGGVNTASADYSTAMGFGNKASGHSSMAMGVFNSATGEVSLVAGQESIAGGDYSMATGYQTFAGGESSVAIGYGTKASGFASTAMGSVTAATNNDSTAMGRLTLAGGSASTAMGFDTRALGYASTAMGSATSATNNDSTAMGRLTLAGGSASTAMGYRARALHHGSFVWADQQEADFDSTSANQFNLRASGGVRFETGGAGLTVDGQKMLTTATTNRSLELSVNGRRALRVEYVTNTTYAIDGINVIGGSSANTVSNGIVGAFIGGGGSSNFPNQVSGYFSSVVGGEDNTASGDYSTAMGFRSLASGHGSTAIGNTTIASGAFSTAMGYGTLAGGHASTAMGYRARALHAGSFVWADFQNADFDSTAVSQFSLRAAGGVRLANDTSLSFGNQTRQMINLWGSEYGIGVQSDATYFRTGNEFMWYRGGSHSDIFGDSGGGDQIMRLGSTGNLVIAGTLSQGSDRQIKQDFTDVNPQAVLDKVAALSIQTWTYTNNAGVRHLGPVAQDFHAAFGLNGEDDKHIATVDADGVALAAIQGLNQKVEEQGAALKSKDARIAELEKRLSAIESLLQK